MKTRLAVLFVMMSFTLAATQVFSAGDRTGNGGDPVQLRAKMIAAFVARDLKPAAMSYLFESRFELMAEPAARAAFEQMVQQGLADDIGASDYRISLSCVGADGVEHAATADLDERGGPICFDVKMLALQQATKAEIIGLVFHEHAHHFGFEDQDNMLYESVYQTLPTSEPSPDPVPTPTPTPTPTPSAD